MSVQKDMTAPHNFVNYPKPREGPAGAYVREDDKNPQLRGLPLVIGSSIVTNLGFVQKVLFKNAKFDSIRDMPDLRGEVATFSPTVIPLADSSGSQPSILDFRPDLTTPRPADQPGRYLSAADYHAAYRSGLVTPLQVVEVLLPLIQHKARQKPESPYATGWVDSHGRTDLALAAARASTDRWARGSPLGILDGVPIGVKDDVPVSGYVCHNGMAPFPASYAPYFAPAKETSPPVVRLEAAGAVVIGKFAMHELGMDTSGCNPAWGTPPNWHNEAYYPGGSSSGAASALCAGIVPMGVCTDAGGSIRIPASFNGLYGLKPSHDRVVVMDSTVCVTGPLAATVADLTLAYRVMSQPDPTDAIQGRFALSRPLPSASSSESNGAPRYLGVFADWWAVADKSVATACRATLDSLASTHGYTIVDVSIPWMREGQLAHAGTCLAEATDYARTRTADPSKWMSILNPTSRVLLSVGQHVDASLYRRFGQVRTLLMRHLAFLYQKYPGLMIVTPTTPMNGWRRTAGDDTYGFTDGNNTIRNMNFVFLANTTGCPAVSCPVGYLEPEKGADKGGRVPVGLMAMGEWGAEEQLLGWAAECESYLHERYPGGRARPEAWVDVLKLATEKKTT